MAIGRGASGGLGEIQIESANRLRNIAQFSFARGGQGIDAESLSALKEGELAAKLKEKQQALQNAREAQLEARRIKETERSAREQERFQQIQAVEARKARKAAEPSFVGGLFGT